MLFKIAWKNIWRNKTRSLVVIVAIMVGVWSVIFLSGFSIGMGQSYVENAIQNEISHIQIHHPEFNKDKDSEFQISDPEDVVDIVREEENVAAATMRTVINGMVASAKSVRGVEIRGINPQTENEVTKLASNITSGEYLTDDKQNGILISESLAEKLKVKLKKKVTLRFQDADNNLIDGAFRVSGIFKTKNKSFDESLVFVHHKKINKLLGIKLSAHEIAIFINDMELLDQTTANLKSKLPALTIETYKEISPDIDLFTSQINMSSSIFTFVVMLGLIFGIINTMLMAVLERTKEIGMLMAIGMNKIKVFLMIVIETLMLGFIGMPVGLFLGMIFINWLSKKGVDLSNWSEGMNEFGMSEIVYPAINNGAFVNLAFAVLLTSLLASIYPAYKAIRLRPVEALHKI